MNEIFASGLFPVQDIACPGSSLSTDKLKEVLAGFGFTFTGSVDKDGLQQAILPPGWKNSEKTPREWHILDEKGRLRARLRQKLPWGDMDEVYFTMIELSSPSANDPREGW